MNQQSIYGLNPSITRIHQQELSQKRVEMGRKAILAGCVIAMIGMITFCYAAISGNPEADLYSSLFENGFAGWSAFLCLVVGVGMWVSGNVALLREEERAEFEN